MLVMHQFYIITMLLTIQIMKVQSTTCKDSVSCKRKISITSFRNNTGHWIAQVTMHHDSSIDANIKARSYPWNIDMSFDRERCNGVEFQKVEALFAIPPLTPGPDYVFYANMGYYKFHPQLKIWQEAKDICESEGAHLAILNSAAESSLLKQMFDQYPNLGNFAYIGFHDLLVEGQYFTIFGEPLKSTGFTEFTGGQPDNHKYGGDNNHPGEDCGSIYRDGKLNDLLCTINAPFICELEI